MSGLFIAGAHTDVGKTHVACALIRAARARGLAVDAFKPVLSGFDPNDWAASDAGRLIAALGRAPTQDALEAMSPWRFAAPLAPPMAAQAEGRRLDLDAIVARAQGWLVGSGLRIVEGAGGLMSPIAEGATGLDLMAALGLPSLLVGGSYLGGISHVLTAVETLRARLAPPLALVISQSGDPQAPDFEATLASVREFAGGLPVFAAPRTDDETWAGEVLAQLELSGAV